MMPQASDEARRRYRARFGDIGAEHAMNELERRGWTLTKAWEWERPTSDPLSEEEEFLVSFLIAEWDFGGLAPTEV